MYFTELDLLFGSAVIILSAISFIGIVCIVIDETQKYRMRSKREEPKKNF